MKVTEEMIYAFNDGVRGNGRALPVTLGDVRAGLEAVFRLIDPVPDRINIITDRDGDKWYRDLRETSGEDPMVWRLTDNPMACSTAAWIVERYGPVTWEGKGE